KSVIAGGNMLLSKRPDMFLPDKWPTYYAKASGCNVTDLDGKTYIDISSMGVGTNILGYNHPVVTDAVVDSISKGNMSTLNAPEEVYLAERLIALNPWSGMVKFARSGGEANAIAVRLGRAVAGKDGVAVCGYHGWHDWYLSANLNRDRNLDGHLLPGLQPLGVPRELSDTVHPFAYNDIAALEAIISAKKIGVIKMEVQRNSPPLPGFLESVRSIAEKNGIVLIFDECTSGFRETSCGLHSKYGVEPDMAVYGKALGNGHAITAVVGKNDVMEAAQSTFISSTFWTERSGSAAALATLDVMTAEASWEVITGIGKSVRDGWQELSQKHDLPINHFGIDALASYSFNFPDNDVYQTFITDYMLARGYLAGSSVYPCIFHSRAIIDSYLNILDEAFGQIAESRRNETPAESLYRGTVRTVGFKRLN
ncbi:aminotransferase class III-fold pyridoxal phosphate-dependent enzyme, partial [Luminiphilus sp.]|nr:aminotransferase class III-fold pyridoxal phosphate-dependent enzyme [Luminiphilus sp.]